MLTVYYILYDVCIIGLLMAKFMGQKSTSIRAQIELLSLCKFVFNGSVHLSLNAET